METVKLITQIAAVVVGCIAAMMSILFFIKLRWPAAALWIAKLFTSALSPFLILVGVLTTIVGLATNSLFISLIGIYDIFIFSRHIMLVTRPPAASGSFEQAFGLDWEKHIPAEQQKRFLPSRWILKLPGAPEPRLGQDIPFTTIPGTNRKLLCDVWQPPENVTPSGLAFIYLHGSAFYFLDKDCGTRTFFRHLAAQGHVIMDVAYRLYPETEMMGMVNDVKRAIVWMKEHADMYKVHRDRIVVGGASAGGHLAMLAAYTSNNPQFTPEDLEGKDIDACAVISLYGTNDMEALYYHTNQHLTTRAIPGRPKKAVPTKIPGWLKKRMGQDYYRLGMDKNFGQTGTLAPLLGGHPDECPEVYSLFSAGTHVHAGCPPTLLIQGADDIMSPINTTPILHSRLLDKRVPAVMNILPQTEHAFDLPLPKISPAAHNLCFDVERFLALMAFLPWVLSSEKVKAKLEESRKHLLEVS
jgi:acetyl esterase/lipase